MNKVKSLKGRIRGWLPKEPSLSKTVSRQSLPKPSTNYYAPAASGPGQRATPLMGTNAILFGILAFMQILQSFSSAYPLSSQWVILAVSIGALFGVVVGLVAAKTQLRILTKKGEIRSSVSFYLYLFGALLIAAGIFIYSTWNATTQTQQLLIDTMSATVPSLGITIYASFRLWEKKYRRVILLDRWWAGRTYVFPKMDVENPGA